MQTLPKTFVTIAPSQIEANFFKKIGDDWMLITAGTAEKFNTMTASWGAIGVLWHEPIAICFIRPQRYTFQFVENERFFTLSFFSEQYKKALQICGTQSGRNCDKIALSGLTPITTHHQNIGFAEASLIMECEKIYHDDIKPQNMLSILPESIYPTKDYHRMFFGKILNCYQNEVEL